MRRIGFLFMLVLSSGCSRTLKTKEIIFYSEGKPNSGTSNVDVVYPKDQTEKDRIQGQYGAKARDWFYAAEREGGGVKCNQLIGPGADPKKYNVPEPRPAKKVGLLLIPELAPPGGVGQTFVLDGQTRPKAKATEYFRIGPGGLERLPEAPAPSK